MYILIIFIGLMIFLFFLGVPIYAAIGLTCLVVLGFQSGWQDLPVSLIPLKMVDSVDNFALLAIPFFILAANIMNKGSTALRIFGFANSLVGHFRGGLGHVNVIASMIFAGMSGTAVGDAAGLGALEIKAMKDQGYPMKYSVGITGASAVIGPIIPPSIAMIIYGWLGDVSIGALFMGGILPGILLALALMSMTVILSFRMAFPEQTRASWAEIASLARRAVLSLMAPIIIVGGIWSGIFTPSECGAMASLYAILLGLFVFKDVSWGDLLQVFKETVEFTAVVLIILSTAGIYGWLLVRLRIPFVLAEKMLGITTDPTLLLLILMFFFLIIGCFMSATESVLIFTPIMIPMIKTVGIDPLFFGIFMIVTLSAGVITPPFGGVIYVLVGITEQTFEFVVKALLPFLIPILIALILMILFPGFVTYLPRVFSG